MATSWGEGVWCPHFTLSVSECRVRVQFNINIQVYNTSGSSKISVILNITVCRINVFCFQ